jgi:hypothetical protein
MELKNNLINFGRHLNWVLSIEQIGLDFKNIFSCRYENIFMESFDSRAYKPALKIKM